MNHNIIPKMLSLTETKDVYDERMREDFPPEELKKWQLVCELFEKGVYEGLGAFEGDILTGYAYFSMDTDHRFYLLDYFAIAKELRGEGYGSDMLKLITERCKDASTLLCEVENPYLEENSTLRLQKQRRMDFYINNGWSDTGIDAWMFDVEYRILSAPIEKRMEPDQLIKAYEIIYRSVIENKQWLYRNMKLRMHE